MLPFCYFSALTAIVIITSFIVKSDILKRLHLINYNSRQRGHFSLTECLIYSVKKASLSVIRLFLAEPSHRARQS